MKGYLWARELFTRHPDSAQHDQLRHGVSASPDDGVLLPAFAQCLDFFQGHAEDQKARLAGLLAGRMLADAFDAFDAGEAELGKLGGQFGIALGVDSDLMVFAEWIPGGDVGAAIDAVTLVCGGQRRAGLPHFQREGLISMHPVFGFPVSLHEAAAND